MTFQARHIKRAFEQRHSERETPAAVRRTKAHIVHGDSAAQAERHRTNSSFAQGGGRTDAGHQEPGRLLQKQSARR